MPEVSYNKPMNRAALIDTVADIVHSTPCKHPLRVAVDGVDASGKTTFSNELAHAIKSQSVREVIQINVDDFHQPNVLRKRRGDLSPEGFYLDSYNYQTFIEQALIPLGPAGNRRYRTACYDLSSDQPLRPPLQSAAVDAIVLIDGIFLLRPTLLSFWELTIYLDVNFEQSIERGINRDAKHLGSREDARLRYQKRYVPGQMLYLRDAHPLDKADILIDNSILEYPRLLRRPMSTVSFSSSLINREIE